MGKHAGTPAEPSALDHDRVFKLLALSTMTLATVGVEALPHAAPVYFVHDESLHLYFFSGQDSQHSRHLRENPEAAAAIYPECQGWRDIRGLQLRGEVRRVAPGESWDSAWARYQVKFPFVRALKTVVSQNQLHVFIPNWIRLVDNARGFGDKQEWHLP